MNDGIRFGDKADVLSVSYLEGRKFMNQQRNEVIQIDTSADYDYLYEGLSRQSLDFPQAIAELVDNAISAMEEGYFTIEILIHKDGNTVEITVADDSAGISRVDLGNHVLRLGGRGSARGSLNEHGFGLKNSLCLLTGNTRPFMILTCDRESKGLGMQWGVEGPFRPDMVGQLGAHERWMKDLTHCRGDTGTRVIATTSFDYFRTTYQRARTLEPLVLRLGEHLGVFYRHWLTKDIRNQIWIRWRDGSDPWKDLLVPGIALPIGRDHESFGLEVDVGGVKARATYVVGSLDEQQVAGTGDSPIYPLVIYYQHNERTQGVDVVVRNKVILLHQLEQLWPGQLRRRERNYFSGELVLEGTVFRTVNNKSDLDPHNPFWISVKEQMNDRADLLPPHYQYAREEAQIKAALKDSLENFATGSKAQVNYPVWTGTGVRADIVHEHEDDGWLDVYEVKDEAAAPQDVYQLIMYWDGLVNDSKVPRQGRLVAESAPNSVINLIAHWNKRTDLRNNPYNVEFKSIADLGVRVVVKSRGRASRSRRARK